MTEYNNENKGVLFSNDKKESENHPDHKGTINIEGKEYWLSCWSNTAKSGQPYMSLSVQEKDAVFDQAKQAVNNAPVADDSDSIPF